MSRETYYFLVLFFEDYGNNMVQETLYCYREILGLDFPTLSYTVELVYITATFGTEESGHFKEVAL